MHKKGHGGRVEAKHASRRRQRKQKPMAQHRNGAGDAASHAALPIEAPACPVANIAEVNAPPVLTDADLSDIIELSREYLWTKGPAQEEDVYFILGPRRSRLVRGVFGSLANCLLREEGFYHQMCGVSSIVYYLDPVSELPDLIRAQTAKEQCNGSPNSSSSGSSYETAPEDEDGDEYTSAPEEEHDQAARNKKVAPLVPARFITARASPLKDLAGGAALQTNAGGCTCTSAIHVARIVKMLKKQRPGNSEAEIRQHVDRVRRLWGGFSFMRLSEIVAAVLEHIDGEP